ncbi:hypothetical protein BD31_I1500 [Candidatus Nitrosopumilus salaria BD31]|uniref:Uncharacterized protein n=1 Tax=Candidatus Nitrosopumilus salarius BD31 TaxID=859350 RepID=I3D3N4_9ARCH|nr:hypothetical protein [Candidatus Nitrosopumilus salaria]EIJ66327.1 hypothetical protein BD31_I1500 [Candidatus Nitrosopumilus salaria BD31]
MNTTRQIVMFQKESEIFFELEMENLLIMTNEFLMKLKLKVTESSI